MKVITRITLIKDFPKNSYVGYGRTFKTYKENTKIAVIPIGHGYGYFRSLSNKGMVIIIFFDNILFIIIIAK